VSKTKHIGCKVLSEIKAPFLKPSTPVPLVVVPSGKISNWLSSPVVSTISYLFLISSIIFCLASAASADLSIYMESSD
jgi:hypothetical protein